MNLWALSIEIFQLADDYTRGHGARYSVFDSDYTRMGRMVL